MACIAEQVRKQEEMLHGATDVQIEGWLHWPEFRRAPVELTADWRHFVRRVKQEAHKHGLKVP